MKQLLKLAVVLVVMNMTSSALRACSCSELKLKTSKKAIQKWFGSFNGAVFVGVVESVEPVANPSDGRSCDSSLPRLSFDTEPATKVVFRIERYWKGVDGESITIYPGIGCCGCRAHFEVGKRYFVTAAVAKDHLETQSCTAEGPNEAKPFEKYLGKGRTLGELH